jgi:hypothetical protein
MMDSAPRTRVQSRRIFHRRQWLAGGGEPPAGMGTTHGRWEPHKALSAAPVG